MLVLLIINISFKENQVFKAKIIGVLCILCGIKNNNSTNDC